MDFDYKVKELLGQDYLITEIFDKGDLVFIFHTTKRIKKSLNDDRLKIGLGIGPILYEKKNNKYKILGSSEFVDLYYPNYFQSEDRHLDSHGEVINRIKKRKHINWGDYEIILNYLNIDEEKIEISSDDDHDIEDEQNNLLAQLVEVVGNEGVIDKLCLGFLDVIKFPYKRTDKNRVEYYNSLVNKE